MNPSHNLRHRQRLNSVFFSILFGFLPVLSTVSSLKAAIVSTGYVYPTPPWLSTATVYVGRYASNGSLLVDAGSLLESQLAYIGNDSGVSGTVTITGTGSAWTKNLILYLGYNGTGTLRVEAGGQVSDSDCYLGSYLGSSGTAIVSGAGSKWTNTSDLYVGSKGVGTLTVSDGGVVTAQNFRASLTSLYGNGTITVTKGAVLDADLRFDAAHLTQTSVAFGSGGVLTVTAAGGDLGAGYQGNGSFTIAEGVSITSSFGLLGAYSGSSGTATVTGAGSMWADNSSLYIGQYGTGSLRVEAGGQVSNTTGYLGSYAGSFGMATVTGAGSKWTNNGDLYVGQDGSGTLTVSDGGAVTAQTLYASLTSIYGNGTITATKGAVLDADLRFDAAHPTQTSIAFGSGGVLTVTAAGGNLGAGYKGNGSLTIAEGVAIASPYGYLGKYSGSSGSATVTGTGSMWTNSNEIYVGYRGSGTLNIEAGGQVTNSYGYLGYSVGSSGSATVTGVGSKWTSTSSVRVGDSGSAMLLIEAGGQVSNSYSSIGLGAHSIGIATVSGTGSMWTNSNEIDVGYYGSGTLNIAAGGQVTNSYGYIGNRSGSSGKATVTGVGSKWTNTADLYVGYDGVGTLTVSDGGLVTTKTLYASLQNLFGNGSITATQGAILDADFHCDATHPTPAILTFGSGGTLTVNSGNILGVGYKGKGSIMVADGKTVNSSNAYLGFQAGSSGTATIIGIGSKWNSGNLDVGYKGIGTISVEAGGRINASSTLGHDAGSSGSVTIRGTGSICNSPTCTVGLGGSGTLRIEAGGQVVDSFGYLGYASGSSGVGMVTGIGSNWTTGGPLEVGSNGTGTLHIEAGGQVTSNSVVLGKNTGSSGTAIVSGTGSMLTDSGSLVVGSAGSGKLHIRGGGVVTASSVSLNSNSLLTIDVGHGSSLRVGDGTGPVGNNGIIRVLTGPQTAAGSQYSPIAGGNYYWLGRQQALGLKWNLNNKSYIVSQTINGVSSTPVTIDLSQQQRVLITETVKNWNIGASFLSKTSTYTAFNLTGTAIAGTDLTALNGLLAPGQSVLNGWNFTTGGSGYYATDPVYLSLGIPAGLIANDMQIWQLSGNSWSRLSFDDLTVNGGYASFTSTGLSNYAITASLPSSTWNVDADGLWQNGSNWTTAPDAPGGINSVALLGSAITAPRTVSLAGPLTLGVLKLDSLQHYTLAGSDSLTLQANPGYNARIDVQASDTHSHVIETPLTLLSPLDITIAPATFLTLAGQVQNPAGQTMTISGGGTLTVTQGIATSGTINVLSGTLSTSSLAADTLTIGNVSTASLAAVPEPRATLLLLAAIAAIAGRFLLRMKKLG